MTQESPEPVRKCANCGAELRPNDRFCGECGLPTFVEPAPETAPKLKSVLAESDKSAKGTWAIVTGIVLILIGLGACAFGSLVLLMVPLMEMPEETGTIVQATSGICCVLPALLLAIAGGVVWYVWGRKKDESA